MLSDTDLVGKFSELSRLRSCEVRLKRICGCHWIRLVARCPELEADLTKPALATSTGAVVLCCNNIILIFTSRRLLHVVSDDSILDLLLCSTNKKLRVLKLKGWRVLI